MNDQPESPFMGEVINTDIPLRDYFAGQALRGLLIAHPEGGKEPYMAFARFAYKLADDMMEEKLKNEAVD